MYTYKTWMRFSSWNWKMYTKWRVLIHSVNPKVVFPSYLWGENATRIRTYMFPQCFVGRYTEVSLPQCYLGVNRQPHVNRPGPGGQLEEYFGTHARKKKQGIGYVFHPRARNSSSVDWVSFSMKNDKLGCVFDHQKSVEWVINEYFAKNQGIGSHFQLEIRDLGYIFVTKKSVLWVQFWKSFSSMSTNICLELPPWGQQLLTTLICHY